MKRKNPHSTLQEVWQYSEGDFERACEILDNTNWDSIFDTENINHCWREWQTTFLNIMSLCIPKKTLSSKEHLPWISKSLLKAIKLRNKLFSAFKRTGSSHKLSQYKMARNRICKEVRNAKKRFLRKSDTSNSKRYWKLFKLLTKKQSSIPVLQAPDSSLVTSDVEKASILNKAFALNFNPIDGHNFEQVDFNIQPAMEFPEELLCTEDQVFALISSLSVMKSTGADGISARMLKQTIHSITPSVTKLFNLSLKTGIFPDDWKFARIVPIPKSGDPTNPSNYRPISILSLLSKLLERHVYNLLSAHFLSFSPLSLCQCGFTSNRSTISALLSFTHDCHRALDNGNELCSIYFDLSKAFDTVPHIPLINKLASMQVNPFLLRWINNYLTNRSQSVALNGVQSSPLTVISGVPQGSVLGPLLFLVYIDGVARSVNHSNVIMYADDIVLYRVIKNPSDFVYIQEDITSICTWISNNHLTLNTQKSCYMLFSRKSHPTLPFTDLHVGGNQALSRVHHYKYLGINYSEDLSWSYHIEAQCKKARKLIGMLFRNFYAYCDSHTLYDLFKCVIMPHLEYGCVVWDPHLSKDITVIENVHKFALRVCSKQWRYSYESLCAIFHTSSMSERRTHLKLLTLFKIIHGNMQLPSSPLALRHVPYAMRSANRHQLAIPMYNTNSFKYSFFPSATTLWNDLPFDTSELSSLTSFKQLITQR